MISAQQARGSPSFGLPTLPSLTKCATAPTLSVPPGGTAVDVPKADEVGLRPPRRTADALPDGRSTRYSLMRRGDACQQHANALGVKSDLVEQCRQVRVLGLREDRVGVGVAGLPVGLCLGRAVVAAALALTVADAVVVSCPG